MKVLELAKRLGTSPQEAILLLEELGTAVKGPDSKVDDKSARTLLELAEEVENEQEEEEEKQENTNKRKKTENKGKKAKKIDITESPEKTNSSQQQDDVKTQQQPAVDDTEVKIVSLPEKAITIKKLAERIRVSVSDLIKEGLRKGIMLNLNQEVDAEVAAELALGFGILVDHEKQKIADIAAVGKIKFNELAKDLITRPPIVTIMGHVDHGKTKLLDTIRSSNVVDSEAGGITQHIGAYQAIKNDKAITFIDTPGHAAFTSLRARGAQVTDIAVIVIAADDGIMPQSVEAIDHARAAGVPIIVAINKIDKPDANVERVKQQLVEHELVPEEWGGKTITVPVSAKQGQGIDDLLEMILLVAEVEDLKANPNKKAIGTVIEAHLSKDKGPIATILVRNGTLKVGDCFTIGSTYGKVRAMFDDHGRKVKLAPPAFPVELIGITDAPHSGDVLEVVADEKAAKSVSDLRRISEKQEQFRKPITLEDFSKEVKENKVNKDLNLLLKADVRGSLEALISSLQKLKVKDVSVQILHQATGQVNESDVMLAAASNAIILAFGVGVNPDAQRLAEAENVNIREYDIIYKLIDDVNEALEGLLDPEYEQFEIGQIEVRNTFQSSKLGTIAGGYVTEGKAIRDSLIKIMRGKALVYEGKLNSLKRFKEDVKEVAKGFECGVVINGFKDFQEGDLVLVAELRQINTRKGQK